MDPIEEIRGVDLINDIGYCESCQMLTGDPTPEEHGLCCPVCGMGLVDVSTYIADLEDRCTELNGAIEKVLTIAKGA